MSAVIPILALIVAFPRAGQRLPPVGEAYMIGAVPRGVTNLTVQGKSVAVYKTGAWATLVPVTPGSNSVEIVAGSEVSNHCFTVERPRPPAPSEPGAKPAEPKPWPKLDYTKDTPRPHPAGRAPETVTIALDPGHGGPSDLGAVSPHDFPEKAANLSLALDVRSALVGLGYRVVMTRTRDEAVPLLDRGRVAVANDADAFVSIHHNAPAADKDPRTCRYHAVYAWNPLGTRLADAISRRMAEALDGDIPAKGVLHANFAVTRSNETPSCLIETDFITSPEGEEAIWNPARRRFIAAAIAKGIDDWRQTPEDGD